MGGDKRRKQKLGCASCLQPGMCESGLLGCLLVYWAVFWYLVCSWSVFYWAVFGLWSTGLLEPPFANVCGPCGGRSRVPGKPAWRLGPSGAEQELDLSQVKLEFGPEGPNSSLT